MTSPLRTFIKRIVSGGQTGADRAGLDWAIKHGVPHGGWCPSERIAEDGFIPTRYQLDELPGGGYRQRTRANVRDSDADRVHRARAYRWQPHHGTVCAENGQALSAPAPRHGLAASAAGMA